MQIWSYVIGKRESGNDERERGGLELMTGERGEKKRRERENIMMEEERERERCQAFILCLDTLSLFIYLSLSIYLLIQSDTKVF